MSLHKQILISEGYLQIALDKSRRNFAWPKSFSIMIPVHPKFYNMMQAKLGNDLELDKQIPVQRDSGINIS